MHVLDIGQFSDIRIILLVSQLEEVDPEHCGRFLGALRHLNGRDVVVRPDAEYWIRVIDQEVRKRRLAHHVRTHVLPKKWPHLHDHCDHMRALAAVTHFHLRTPRR